MNRYWPGKITARTAVAAAVAATLGHSEGEPANENPPAAGAALTCAADETGMPADIQDADLSAPGGDHMRVDKSSADPPSEPKKS